MSMLHPQSMNSHDVFSQLDALLTDTQVQLYNKLLLDHGNGRLSLLFPLDQVVLSRCRGDQRSAPTLLPSRGLRTDPVHIE